ncbi:MAG: hypothetical protein JJ863_37275 [Deltaproteobacteria bacterium]|nr:hypothetical protein [Deltaproteobacteria bacterium]
MKGTSDVDPSIYECGPASDSVHSLLRLHAAVDWFVPPVATPEDARTTLEHYQRLALAFAPDLCARSPTIEVRSGHWPDFQRLCETTRENLQWDWKFGVLKPLTKRHSEAQGWSKPLDPPVTATEPTPSAPFLRIGDAILWNIRVAQLDLSLLDDPQREAARFFKQWADYDTFDAVEWQLAEPGCALEDNPFTHLLQLYEGGYYPFHLAKDRVVLFHFSPNGPCTTF